MNRIKHYRKLAKCTQGELALKAGVRGQSNIGHYERGVRSPDIRTAHNIVKAFNSSGLNVSFVDVFPPPEECAS